MKLAVIGGDGIGPEVTAEALKVLNAVRDDIETTEYDLGARRYLRNGELLTDADLASIREHDAILLGAIGEPGQVPPGILERGLLLKMRFALDHHVNLRPSSCTQRLPRRWRTQERSTSSSSARAQRACTAATVAPCARALRTR